MNDYHHIVNAIYDTPWFITQQGMETICAIVDRKMKGDIQLTAEELDAIRLSNSKARELELPDKPSVAVLGINGPIFPKANLMSNLSGATSLDKLNQDFSTLMDSDMVTGIVLDVDSPGGRASMITEAAQLIYDARQEGKKPIYAVANPMCCSAAYYLASQADKLYATPSADVGSIGTIAFFRENGDSEEGKVHVISAGKYKSEANPHEPLSDEARAHLQSLVDEHYMDFVTDVARGRGIEVNEVLENYGQGRYYKSKTAQKRGMIDGIKTLETVVGELSSKPTSISVPTSVAATRMNGGTKMELTPELLELLGLGEDATIEDVTAKLTELTTPVVKVEETTPSLPEDLLEKYPEIAERLSRVDKLEAKDRETSATLFAQTYSRFTTEAGESNSGFSALALDQIQELHVKISDGVVTHDDLKTFLDNVASEKAIVEYGERGTTREAVNSGVETGYAAGAKLVELARARMVETGDSYGDALAQVRADNPQLSEQYESSIPRPYRNGGDD